MLAEPVHTRQSLWEPSLLAMAVCQATSMLNVSTSSRAGSLPHGLRRLDAETVTQRVIRGAHGGQWRLEGSAADHRHVWQGRKRIKALGVAADHFRDQFAGQVRAGDAVAAVALHVVGVLFD